MEPTTPNGCRWCGLPEREHYRQWKQPVGWHSWAAPTDGQRKERMLARRTQARAADAVDEAAANMPCMACGAIGVRQDTRLCEPCLALPYGTVGELATDSDECAECYEPRYVWYGNMWCLRHREPGRDFCDHSCHEGEIGLASNSIKNDKASQPITVAR